MASSTQGDGKLYPRCSQGLGKVLARCSHTLPILFPYFKVWLHYGISMATVWHPLGKGERRVWLLLGKGLGMAWLEIQQTRSSVPPNWEFGTSKLGVRYSRTWRGFLCRFGHLFSPTLRLSFAYATPKLQKPILQPIFCSVPDNL